MSQQGQVERLVRVWWWSATGCACERVPVQIAGQVRRQLRAEGFTSWVTRCSDRVVPEPF